MQRPKLLANGVCSEEVELVDVPLSDAFQELELRQQRNPQIVIDALQHGHDFFEGVLLRHAKAIQDSNAAEHEQTRATLSKTHSETLDQVQQGSDTTQRTTVIEADRTRDLITVRFGDSRAQAQSSSDHDITRTSITSAHDATRAQVIDSIKWADRCHRGCPCGRPTTDCRFP